VGKWPTGAQPRAQVERHQRLSQVRVALQKDEFPQRNPLRPEPRDLLSLNFNSRRDRHDSRLALSTQRKQVAPWHLLRFALEGMNSATSSSLLVGEGWGGGKITIIPTLVIPHRRGGEVRGTAHPFQSSPRQCRLQCQ